MKLVAVNGSPRKNGNTSELIDNVIEGVRSCEKTDVVSIMVIEKKIQYCTGCLTCTYPPPGRDSCVIDDDMAGMLGQMRDADAFIFGTPNHMRTVSAPLLVFLSRLLPLMEFMPDMNDEGKVIGGGFTSKLKGKKAAMVISQGDPVFSSALVCEVLERNLIDLGIRRVGDVISRGNMAPGDAAKKEADMEKAFQLGVALATTEGLY